MSMSASPNSYVAGYSRGASVPIGRAAGHGHASVRPSAAGRMAERPAAKRPATQLREVSGGAPSARKARGSASRAGAPSRDSSRRDSSKASTRFSAASRGATAARTTGEAAKNGISGAASSVVAWVEGHRGIAIVLALTLLVVGTLYAPLQSYYVATRANEALTSQLSAINASNEVMQAQVDALMTKEGIEDEARRRGYVEEGESAVDMSGVTDSQDPSSDPTVTSSGTGSSSDSGDASSSEAASDAADSSSSEQWYTGMLDFIFAYDPEKQGVA